MRLSHLMANFGGVWNLLEDNGYQPDGFFQEAGIDPEALKKPGARIDLNRGLDLWALVNSLFNDPCLGLKFTKYWHPSQQGALGYAWVSSKTIRDGLNRVVRYITLLSEGVDINVSEDADTVTVSLDFLFEDYRSLLPFFGTVGMANFLAMCRLVYGKKLFPLGVTFKQTKPECSDEFYAYFRSDVKFGMDKDSITFSSEILDKALTGYDPMMTKYTDQVAARYLALLKSTNITEKVKVIIVELLPSGEADAKTVAKRLYLSDRSLSRRLNEVGTTFRELLEETRRDMALQYMKDENVSLHEVSYLLGYKDYSSFFRAFKRWTGTSPTSAVL